MLADVLSHILNRSSLSPYMYIHIFYCVTYRMTHNHRILIYLAPQEKMNTTSLKVTCSCLSISATNESVIEICGTELLTTELLSRRKME